MTEAAAVAFTVVPGPWGPVHVGVRSGAIVAVELMTPTDAFVAGLARRLGGPVLPFTEADAAARDLLEAARSELGEYLAGARRAFDLPLELAGLGEWDRAVLAGVATIPFGRVSSYGRVARMIGRPGAARAVGGAVGRNPIGILIPCHRVVAGDGSLGGYGGDWYGTREELLAIKRELLEREGTRLPAGEFVG